MKDYIVCFVLLLILQACSSVWLERTPDKGEDGGSIPLRPIFLNILCWVDIKKNHNKNF